MLFSFGVLVDIMSSNWLALFFTFMLVLSVSSYHSSFADNYVPPKPKTLFWQLLHGTLQENVMCYNGLVLIKRIHPSYFADRSLRNPTEEFASWVLIISVAC